MVPQNLGAFGLTYPRIVRISSPRTSAPAPRETSKATRPCATTRSQNASSLNHWPRQEAMRVWTLGSANAPVCTHQRLRLQRDLPVRHAMSFTRSRRGCSKLRPWPMRFQYWGLRVVEYRHLAVIDRGQTLQKHEVHAMHTDLP